MLSEFIIEEWRDSVVTIRLDRPEKRNALSPQMILTLSDIFSELNSQPHVRAVILTGTGDAAFCAGLDTGAQIAASEQADARSVSELCHALCDQIESSGVPVIAAVNGIATGVGCELALACHLKIATDSAQFSLHEASAGSSRASDSIERLARQIGNERVLEIVLTGKTISAAEALEFGLINRVAPAAKLRTQAEDFAGEIGQLAPLAIRACLEAVIQGAQLPLTEGLELEAKLFASLFDSDDVREGTSAFLEKREPIFKGK